MTNEQKKETNKQPFWQRVKADYKKIMEMPDPKAAEREARYQEKRAKARKDLDEIGGGWGCFFKGLFFLIVGIPLFFVVFWFALRI